MPESVAISTADRTRRAGRQQRSPFAEWQRIAQSMERLHVFLRLAKKN
jgi:hypothetical protein